MQPDADISTHEPSENGKIGFKKTKKAGLLKKRNAEEDIL